MIGFDIGLDLFPLLAATLAAISCALLGNFLVLRKLSLMGDAISHSVLPGLVVAFLITSTRSPFVMLTGAAITGILTVVLVEVIKRVGRIEPGAAMGVVFSIFFALGVLLIEQAAARHIDLDADCVLHGQLETLVWFDAPAHWKTLLSLETLAATPRQVWTLLVMCGAISLFVTVLFKELRIASFDAALATTLGFHATALHYLLMVFVAGATVASFEAVGSILVIAMLICPAATARLLTDTLRTQIFASVLIAASSAMLGYFGATAIPALFGKDSVNAAGSITMMSGILLAIAIVASPKHGLIAKQVRNRSLTRNVELDDLLATLFRASEQDKLPMSKAAIGMLLPAVKIEATIHRALKQRLIEVVRERVLLTPVGRSRAAELVRRHRLWETYLVYEADIDAEHVHDTAEQLEHISIQPRSGPSFDPHGRPIP